MNTEHEAFIRQHYLVTPIKRLAREINKSETYVRNRMKELGLQIPKEVLRQRKEDNFSRILENRKNGKYAKYQNKKVAS